MLRLFNVSKRYCKRIWALREVSFEVSAGQSLLLCGGSGAGKSTLFRLIYGDEKPDLGQIVVSGRNISKLRRSSLPFFRRQVGFVFQGLELMETRTILENVAFPLYLHGVWGRKAQKRAERACRLVGLESGLKRGCAVLSQGEQQLVTLARALVAEPSLILADEPTAHLDSQKTMHVLNLLTRLAVRGATILVASADNMVARCFNPDMVIELTRGRMQTTAKTTPISPAVDPVCNDNNPSAERDDGSLPDQSVGSVCDRSVDRAGPPATEASPSTAAFRVPVTRKGAHKVVGHS
jgi:cell division transport system ATP-binding protein